MKKLILIPTDPDQKPIDVLINRIAIKGYHLKIVFIDGTTRYLPRNQVKEYKIIEVDEEAADEKPNTRRIN